MNTHIGITRKNGIIKVVEYLGDGEILSLGIELHDYFKDRSDVIQIVKTTVDYIEDGEINFDEDDDTKVFEEYEDIDDLRDTVDFDFDMYYIYDNDRWYVISNKYDYEELEIILGEE